MNKFCIFNKISLINQLFEYKIIIEILIKDEYLIFTDLMNFFWPHRSLYFSYMEFIKEEHTDTRLSYSTTNSVWKLFVDKSL